MVEGKRPTCPLPYENLLNCWMLCVGTSLCLRIPPLPLLFCRSCWRILAIVELFLWGLAMAAVWEKWSFSHAVHQDTMVFLINYKHCDENTPYESILIQAHLFGYEHKVTCSEMNGCPFCPQASVNCLPCIAMGSGQACLLRLFSITLLMIPFLSWGRDGGLYILKISCDSCPAPPDLGF